MEGGLIIKTNLHPLIGPIIVQTNKTVDPE